MSGRTGSQRRTTAARQCWSLGSSCWGQDRPRWRSPAQHGSLFDYLTTVQITDRRLVFLSNRFDKGGGWVGFGVVGLCCATTANVVSKRQAAARSSGKVAIGQVRYEWVDLLELSYQKAGLSSAHDAYVSLHTLTSAGPALVRSKNNAALDRAHAQ